MATRGRRRERVLPADSLARSASFWSALRRARDIDGHPPDIDIRPDGVTVKLLTAADDWYGPTRRDLGARAPDLGGRRDRGLVAEPPQVQSMLIVIGARDPAQVMPFWQAAFDYIRRPDSPDEDLVDPRGRGPAIWFETIGQRAPGGRRHPPRGVAPAGVAEARVEAALAAGGRLVRDTPAPTWWTLADVEGNEIDVSTVVNRE